MKRKTIILALASGLLALASCNKAELPGMGTIPADNAVRFGVTGITVTTKADVAETLTASLDAGFDVAGFVNGTPDVKMFNELASKNGTWWETTTHYYFPLAGTMDFIAAFPSKTGSVITEGVTGVYGVDYLNTENHDLVVASASDVAKTDLVPLTFDHVLSQVIVKMKGSNPDLTYKLTSVGFEVPSEGFYVLRDETGSHAGKVGKWQPSSFIGTDVSSTVIRPIDIASGSFEEVPTAGYAKVGDSFVIMPGENVPFSVKWTCEDSAGNVVGVYDETVEIDGFTMGKRTTLNVLLPCDATGIRFSAKANAWEDVTKDVSMLPAAKHAVAASEGDTVTLPKLRLDEGTEGCIVWGDGTREEFSNAATKAGSGVSYLVPEHEYTDDFTGDVKFYVNNGKITAARFKDDPSYIIVDEMLAELEPIRALRFTCDEPAYIIFISGFTGSQNLEYSYDGFEWETWSYQSSLSFVLSMLHGTAPDPSVVTSLTTDPESAGVLISGPDMTACGYPDRKSVYVRGDNPDGFNTSQEYLYGYFLVMNTSLISNPSAVDPVPVHCEGNIMHLLSYEEDMTGIPCSWCFSNLFNMPSFFPSSSTFYSLIDVPELPATELAEGCYYQMFTGCTSLVDAPELPATQLTDQCYYQMFAGCSSLVDAPELPATQLAKKCYKEMFRDCTSLVNAPELPATELAEDCYSYMFNRCTSLVDAPELPATKLAFNCYYSMFNRCTSLVNVPPIGTADTRMAAHSCTNMFYNCTSLVNAPELPATELAKNCYEFMFDGCTSLVNTPELPATELVKECYLCMFSGCTSLVNAPELPATELAEYCYRNMFSGCTSLEAVTMKATDVSASYCLGDWLSGAGTSATNPTLYVDPSMVGNSTIDYHKGVFSVASIE